MSFIFTNSWWAGSLWCHFSPYYVFKPNSWSVVAIMYKILLFKLSSTSSNSSIAVTQDILLHWVLLLRKLNVHFPHYKCTVLIPNTGLLLVTVFLLDINTLTRSEYLLHESICAHGLQVKGFFTSINVFLICTKWSYRTFKNVHKLKLKMRLSVCWVLSVS